MAHALSSEVEDGTLPLAAHGGSFEVDRVRFKVEDGSLPTTTHSDSSGVEEIQSKFVETRKLCNKELNKLSKITLPTIFNFQEMYQLTVNFINLLVKLQLHSSQLKLLLRGRKLSNFKSNLRKTMRPLNDMLEKLSCISELSNIVEARHAQQSSQTETSASHSSPSSMTCPDFRNLSLSNSPLKKWDAPTLEEVDVATWQQNQL